MAGMAERRWMIVIVIDYETNLYNYRGPYKFGMTILKLLPWVSLLKL